MNAAHNERNTIKEIPDKYTFINIYIVYNFTTERMKHGKRGPNNSDQKNYANFTPLRIEKAARLNRMEILQEPRIYKYYVKHFTR